MGLKVRRQFYDMEQCMLIDPDACIELCMQPIKKWPLQKVLLRLTRDLSALFVCLRLRFMLNA